MTVLQISERMPAGRSSDLSVPQVTVSVSVSVSVSAMHAQQTVSRSTTDASLVSHMCTDGGLEHGDD